MKIFLKIFALTTVLALLFTFNQTVLGAYYRSTTLYGSFTAKAERAASIEENKFIIIGGSASNLAFDSAKFEALSGKPAVNLAISAAVPLRVYMQAAENCAVPGDTIFLIPEYSYYNQDFRAIDEAYIDMVQIDPSLKCEETLPGNVEYLYTAFLRSFTKLNDCFLFALRNFLQSGNTIYVADSVDAYGDFCLHKDREPTYERATVSEQFAYDPGVLDEIASFMERMERKDVTVYLSYPPIDGYCYEDYEIYFTAVRTAVESHISPERIIGTPFDFLYDADFFFDTAYHIRYENREIYTEGLFDHYLTVCSQ